MAIGITVRRDVLGTRFLLGATRGLARRFEVLASGDRIARAAFDAAGLALSETLRASVGSREQGLRNLNDGLSAARVAEGALDETSDLLGRMRELAVQAQNGTVGAAQKRVLQDEFDALADEVTRIADRTEFNGRKLLDGGAPLPIVGEPEGEPIEIAADDQSAAALGVAGLDVGNAASLDSLDLAIRSVARSRAGLGSSERRIESSIRQLRSERENLAAAESRIRDADYASETSLLARDGLLSRIGIAVRAQANVSALAALRLLRP